MFVDDVMKKILIFGSILAVTLLILASFPSVVGSNTEQSNMLDRIEQVRNNLQSGFLIKLALLLPVLWFIIAFIVQTIGTWLLDQIGL